DRVSSLTELWNGTVQAYMEAIEGCELHDGLVALWTFVGAANRVVDAEKPWELAKAWKGGDEASGDRLRGVLGDLIEACRLVGLAVAPFMPGAAPRVLGPRGFRYGYGPDGNGEASVLGELEWGACANEAGRVGDPEPLFPRLEVEAVETGPAGRQGAGTPTRS